MSNQFFPTLHTSSWKMSRTPQWQTTVKTGVSGDRKRAPLQDRPRWRWTLKNGILQTAAGDLQAIQNLYIAMYGRLDFFLWKDPEGDTLVDPTVQIDFLGDYFWPVAFTSDAMDFDRFAYQLWECGTCEFEQVLPPQPSSGGTGGGFTQFPNGAPVTATLSYLTSHIDNGGNNGVANATLGSGLALFDSASYTLRTDTTSWSNLHNQWSGPIGPPPGNANPVDATVGFYLSGLGIASPTVAKLRVYDAYMDVVYENGVSIRYRPTVAQTIAGSIGGSITDPANAVDGDASTYAEIAQSALGGDGWMLKLSVFVAD